MSQTKAHQSTSPVERGGIKPTAPKNQKVIFFGASLDMAWQLALVVLIPIIGGYELDEHLHTLPALTIVGFVLAMVGTFVVIKRMLLKVDQMTNKPKESK